MVAGRVLFSIVVLTFCPACGTVGLEDAVSDGKNGEAILLPEGDFDFGDVSPSSRHASSLTLEVKSVGIDPVTVQDAWLDTEDMSVFYLAADPFPKRIYPGDSVPFDVKFEPSQQDHFRAVVHIVLETGGEITRNILGIGCGDGEHDGVCDADQ